MIVMTSLLTHRPLRKVAIRKAEKWILERLEMSDGLGAIYPAMLNAITKKFPDSARQRCVVHKMDNVLSYVPTKQQEQLKPELKALFYQKDRQAADLGPNRHRSDSNRFRTVHRHTLSYTY